MQNLNSKDLWDIYSGQTVSARTQRSIDAARDLVIRSGALENHIETQSIS